MQARQVIRAAVVELWSRRTTLPQAVSTIPCFLCSLVNAVNVGGWTTLRCVVAVRSAFVMPAAVGGVGFGVAWGDVRVAGVGLWGVWGYGSRWAHCTFLGRPVGPGFAVHRSAPSCGVKDPGRVGRQVERVAWVACGRGFAQAVEIAGARAVWSGAATVLCYRVRSLLRHRLVEPLPDAREGLTAGSGAWSPGCGILGMIRRSSCLVGGSLGLSSNRTAVSSRFSAAVASCRMTCGFLPCARRKLLIPAVSNPTSSSEAFL